AEARRRYSGERRRSAGIGKSEISGGGRPFTRRRRPSDPLPLAYTKHCRRCTRERRCEESVECAISGVNTRARAGRVRLDEGRTGKIQVTPSKPFKDQRDLSLAYTPGVAEPCLEIAKRPEDAYLYTSKGNLVAVVSNGTAVLGLGNIGALAGKPVMEGKGILFKAFADIDVFDLEVGSENPEDVI